MTDDGCDEKNSAARRILFIEKDPFDEKEFYRIDAEVSVRNDGDGRVTISLRPNLGSRNPTRRITVTLDGDAARDLRRPFHAAVDANGIAAPGIVTSEMLSYRCNPERNIYLLSGEHSGRHVFLED